MCPHSSLSVHNTRLGSLFWFIALLMTHFNIKHVTLLTESCSDIFIYDLFEKYIVKSNLFTVTQHINKCTDAEILRYKTVPRQYKQQYMKNVHICTIDNWSYQPSMDTRAAAIRQHHRLRRL